MVMIDFIREWEERLDRRMLVVLIVAFYSVENDTYDVMLSILFRHLFFETIIFSSTAGTQASTLQQHYREKVMKVPIFERV